MANPLVCSAYSPKPYSGANIHEYTEILSLANSEANSFNIILLETLRTYRKGLACYKVEIKIEKSPGNFLEKSFKKARPFSV